MSVAKKQEVEIDLKLTTSEVTRLLEALVYSCTISASIDVSSEQNQKRYKVLSKIIKALDEKQIDCQCETLSLEYDPSILPSEEKWYPTLLKKIKRYVN